MKERTSTFTKSMANPVIRNMSVKAREFQGGSDTATYQGIGIKTGYFLVVSLVGIIAFFLMHNIFMNSAATLGGTFSFIDEDGLFIIETCPVEVIVVCVAAVISLFAPFIAWFIRPAIPVAGTIYALSEGLFVGFITQMLAPEFKWVSFVAFILTIAVVGGMLFLYTSRIIKATHKFRMVISAIFFSSLIGSLLLFIAYFIPFLRPVVMGIASFLGNPLISIGLSVFYLIVAALFLISDFDTIEQCVKNKMPKELEWVAAWGLAYTIIYIYFKILNLILEIIAASKD